MKYTYYVHRLLLFSVLSLLFSFSSFAQTIKGKVTDSKTGEPLVGATVSLTQSGVKKSTAVALNGAYSFKNVKTGSYQLSVNYVGYKTSQIYEGNITLT